jgi:hypothetical protein
MTDQMNGMIILNAIPDAGVEEEVGNSCRAMLKTSRSTY